MLRTPPRFADPSLPPLDEADLKLISMLVHDGRASGRDLAMATGISEANVSRRLTRLLDEKSIRVLGFVPPEYLGFHVQFAVFVHARNDGESVARRLAALPYFSMVLSCFGFCDVVAYGIAEHGPGLVEILNSCLYGQDDVADANVSIVLEFCDIAHKDAASKAAAAPPRTLDAVDRRIIREIQAEGRMSFTDLAASIGVSPTSAADRFRRLLADGTVRILGLPDPARVGLALTGYLHVMVDGSAYEVQRELSKFPEIGFQVMQSGDWPIGCEFMVRDDTHFDALRRQIMATPGVHQTRVLIHRRVHRMSFVFDPVAPLAPTPAAEPSPA